MISDDRNLMFLHLLFLTADFLNLFRLSFSEVFKDFFTGWIGVNQTSHFA